MPLTRKNEKPNIVIIAAYLAFAIPTFFYIDGAIEAGGFGLMYHYLYGMGICVLAFFVFLLRGASKNLASLIKWAIIFSLSYIVPTIYSTFLWCFNFSAKNYISKGLFYNVYMLIAIAVCVATVYMFGEYAVPISITAMGIANIMIIAPIAQSNPSEFVQEMITLIVSFGNETGSMMKSVEIHDLTFAFGLYLLYALVRRDCPCRWYVVAVGLIFSLTGLKRIAFIGIGAGFFLVRFLQMLPQKKSKNLSYLVCGCIVAFSYIYIIAVHSGLFDLLEEIGINTMGRNLIYQQLNTLFEFSPFFLGNGIGFSAHAWDNMTGRNVIHDAFHNEYIRMYVEIGFWGYAAWWLLNIFTRLKYAYKWLGTNGGLYLFSMIFFLYCTYSSDNTYYYYYTSMALFLPIMCTHRDDSKIYPFPKSILKFLGRG